MIVESAVYLIVFGIAACMAFLFQRFYNLAGVNYYFFKSKKINTLAYCVEYTYDEKGTAIEIKKYNKK